jgi:hypothetical protein
MENPEYMTMMQRDDGSSPTREQRRATIGFGAVESGYQTLARLARHVER